MLKAKAHDRSTRGKVQGLVASNPCAPSLCVYLVSPYHARSGSSYTNRDYIIINFVVFEVELFRDTYAWVGRDGLLNSIHHKLPP